MSHYCSWLIGINFKSRNRQRHEQLIKKVFKVASILFSRLLLFLSSLINSSSQLGPTFASFCWSERAKQTKSAVTLFLLLSRSISTMKPCRTLGVRFHRMSGLEYIAATASKLYIL